VDGGRLGWTPRRSRESIALPQAGRLLITCDAGGSNGYRRRSFKAELAAFAERSGPAVTICTLPSQ
jgi:hypothetical protein